MCGIVAVTGEGDRDGTGLALDRARAVDRALGALAHRGPDGHRRWVAADGSVALGHTRLAVIDREGGAQPIANEDGSIVAVVNGELYDHEAHARALAARGHRLRSRCDAEVLVHLYEEHGDDFVDHVRGELAFVLWDARRRRLLAGRDRFGIKPLVWARHGTGVAIASEAKALFALGVPARWDDTSFFHAAHTQYPWPDRTLFAGVHVLEPGCVMAWQAGAPAIRRYYAPPFPRADAAVDGADSDHAGALRAALDDAVRVRLRADARICVQLSGGIDSSAVAGLAARAGGIEGCFTVGFAGAASAAADGYDERAFAEATATRLGLPLHVVELDGAAIAAHWPDAVTHGEGLAINGHLVGKFLLSRAMRDAGFKVALTGEGADEVLAGYPHLRQDAGAQVTGHGASRGVMLPAGDASDASDLQAVRARLGFVPTWLAAKASLGARVHGLLAPDLRARHAAADPYGALIERLDGRLDGAAGNGAAGNGGVRNPVLGTLAPMHASAATWMRTALASYILRTLGDGMEMRHGIEGRVPFLDHHVAAVALAIPPAVAAAVAGPPTLDKPVLRQAVADVVSPGVLARAKHPFLAPPLTRLAPALVQDTLRTHARRSSLVDGSALIALLDRIPAMDAATQQLWDPALMLLLSAAILETRYCR